MLRNQEAGREKIEGKSSNLNNLAMEWQGEHVTGEAATLFNSTITAAAISLAFEIGLLNAIAEQGSISVGSFCQAHGLHIASVKSCLYALQCYDIVLPGAEKDTVQAGVNFGDIFRNKGYFLWLVGGYGKMLQNLTGSIRLEKRNGTVISRDGKSIAMAGRDYGAQFVDRHFTEVLEQMPFKVVADLGCGSGERLINLARQRDDLRCVGMDLNRDAVSLAQESVTAAGLENRVTILHADVSKLTPLEVFKDVEVLFCFFMAHDLWPRENCLMALRQIRAAFPNAKRFLLSDTYRSDLPPSRQTPIFTLGFELTHAVMGQYIPSVSEWAALFEDAGWNCVGRRDLDIPFSSIFDLR